MNITIPNKLVPREEQSATQSIPFHNHCQATVLSIFNNKYETIHNYFNFNDDDGTNTSINITNLPSWKEKFKSNTFLYQDLGSIIQLIDDVAGSVQDLPPASTLTFKKNSEQLGEPIPIIGPEENVVIDLGKDDFDQNIVSQESGSGYSNIRISQNNKIYRRTFSTDTKISLALIQYQSSIDNHHTLSIFVQIYNSGTTKIKITHASLTENTWEYSWKEDKDAINVEPKEKVLINYIINCENKTIEKYFLGSIQMKYSMLKLTSGEKEWGRINVVSNEDDKTIDIPFKTLSFYNGPKSDNIQLGSVQAVINSDSNVDIILPRIESYKTLTFKNRTNSEVLGRVSLPMSEEKTIEIPIPVVKDYSDLTIQYKNNNGAEQTAIVSVPIGTARTIDLRNIGGGDKEIVSSDTRCVTLGTDVTTITLQRGKNWYILGPNKYLLDDYKHSSEGINLDVSAYGLNDVIEFYLELHFEESNHNLIRLGNIDLLGTYNNRVTIIKTITGYKNAAGETCSFGGWQRLTGGSLGKYFPVNAGSTDTHVAQTATTLGWCNSFRAYNYAEDNSEENMYAYDAPGGTRYQGVASFLLKFIVNMKNRRLWCESMGPLKYWDKE